MTQPDPDPTNRELVRVLAQFQDQRLPPAIRLTVPELLDALDASGYQIVPKVELENWKRRAMNAEHKLEYLKRLAALTRAQALQALDKENG